MEPTWIWQQPDWPAFRWHEAEITPLVQAVRFKLGLLLGKSAADGQSDRRHTFDSLLINILASSAIEDEKLNAQSVRSSLAKRLGISDAAPYPTSGRSEGLAEMMLDAIANLDSPLTLERLLHWHRWLFPSQALSLYDIRAGQLRGEEPMQVVSGRIDRPKVHFIAPPRQVIDAEIERFLAWFNQSHRDRQPDLLLRAAICRFWFVTLHPFDDGNGRITRALTDLALAQADNQTMRLYAMAAAILKQRGEYYQVPEQSQRGTLDITRWLAWFLNTLVTTLDDALTAMDKILLKNRFWQHVYQAGLAIRQVKVLNRLLDGGDNGFKLGISAAQYPPG
ncbi:Fic family protein [Sodalis sp. RH21]|uniref:Fic family protein n=1 Tax=unclassified Sodalis (in: enterobacteria) TaxID=2636512 RepID=UPI0039B66D8C